MSPWETGILAATIFAATNIDDIFLLLMFFADRHVRPRQVVIGQYLGILTLVAASLVLSLVSLMIPERWIGLLGIIPLALGIRSLVTLVRSRKEAAGDEVALPTSQRVAARVAGIAGVTIANGGDNIGVYTPIFATTAPEQKIIILAVFIVMTAIWCSVAYYLVSHPSLGRPIRQFGHVAFPFVLIGLGIWLIYGTLTS